MISWFILRQKLRTRRFCRFLRFLQALSKLGHGGHPLYLWLAFLILLDRSPWSFQNEWNWSWLIVFIIIPFSTLASFALLPPLNALLDSGLALYDILLYPRLYLSFSLWYLFLNFLQVLLLLQVKLIELLPRGTSAGTLADLRFGGKSLLAVRDLFLLAELHISSFAIFARFGLIIIETALFVA